MSNSNFNIMLGDYADRLKEIDDCSIDLVLCDPPYGTTPLEWDKEIDFSKFWQLIERVIKPTTPVLIFAQEPFASKLRLSNLDWYKYDWYWKKERPTNIFQVKRRPAKYVENICVFYKEQCLYFPQKVQHTGNKVTNKVKGTFSQSISANQIKPTEYKDDGTRYPCEILEFTRDVYYENLHPTQKPVALLEYLIKTYTEKEQTVLDMFMGSGSTGVACLKTNRNFIGIDSDETYFEISKKRLADEWSRQRQRLF